MLHTGRIRIGWERAKTLGETVYQLVKEKKTHEPEFQMLLKYHGREKLLALFRDEVKREKNEK